MCMPIALPYFLSRRGRFYINANEVMSTPSFQRLDSNEIAENFMLSVSFSLFSNIFIVFVCFFFRTQLKQIYKTLILHNIEISTKNNIEQMLWKTVYHQVKIMFLRVSGNSVVKHNAIGAGGLSFDYRDTGSLLLRYFFGPVLSRR